MRPRGRLPPSYLFYRIISRAYFLNPFFAAKTDDAPEGFYDIIGFEGDVNPEGWPVEDKAGEAAKRN